MIVQASAVFHAVKFALIDASALSKDALHIYSGLGIYLTIRLLWRGRRGAWIAWGIVLAATLAGEFLDLKGEELSGGLQSGTAHWHDIWNTMAWPTLLLLVEKWLVRAATDPDPAGVIASGKDAERGGEQA